MSGSLRLEQKSTIPFFHADAVSGIIDVSFLRVGGTELIGKMASGVSQLGIPSASERTIELDWANPATTKVQITLAGDGPAETLRVTVNNGSFTVKSNVASGSHFYWQAYGL